jgi:protein CpxP
LNFNKETIMKRVLFFLLLAVPLFAQQQPGMMRRQGPDSAGRERMGGPHGPMMEGNWWKNTELAKKLNLTDQQVAQMEQIYQQGRLQLIDKVAAAQKADLLLEPMLAADRPDESQVLAQIDKVAQTHADLEKSRARMLLGIRQVLSAEQWKQLKAEMPPPQMRRMTPDGPGGQGGRRGPDGPQGPPPPQPEDE